MEILSTGCLLLLFISSTAGLFFLFVLKTLFYKGMGLAFLLATLCETIIFLSTSFRNVQNWFYSAHYLKYGTVVLCIGFILGIRIMKRFDQKYFWKGFLCGLLGHFGYIIINLLIFLNFGN